MLGNISSPLSNAPPPPGSNSSLDFYTLCLLSRPSCFVFMALDATTAAVMLPLCALVLSRAVRERAAAASPTSPSDCFTHHLVAMETVGALGYLANLVGICAARLDVLRAAGFLTALTWYGQVFFHALTCADRYLAVVHPVAYLRLRDGRGARVRAATVASAWALSLAGMCLMMLTDSFHAVDFSVLALSTAVFAFCSASVLCVLIRPGPGPGPRRSVDQSKQRASYTIAAILGVMVVRYSWNVAWELVFMYGGERDCVVLATCVWFNLPSSLLLPLLYLHRKGLCC